MKRLIFRKSGEFFQREGFLCRHVSVLKDRGDAEFEARERGGGQCAADLDDAMLTSRFEYINALGVGINDPHRLRSSGEELTYFAIDLAGGFRGRNNFDNQVGSKFGPAVIGNSNQARGADESDIGASKNIWAPCKDKSALRTHFTEIVGGDKIANLSQQACLASSVIPFGSGLRNQLPFIDFVKRLVFRETGELFQSEGYLSRHAFIVCYPHEAFLCSRDGGVGVFRRARRGENRQGAAGAGVGVVAASSPEGILAGVARVRQAVHATGRHADLAR